MSEPSYDIYFRGEILEGFDADQVKRNIAQLFKAPPEKVAALFSGKVVALKKGLDKPAAAKFQQALKNAGAKIYIKQAEENVLAAAAPQPAETPAAAPASTPAPETTQVTTAVPVTSLVSVDTSTIRMASMFDVDPAMDAKPAPPVPDVSHISVAAVGVDVLEGIEHAAPPPAPDVSFISLADVGEDLIEESIEIPLPAPDIGHISLAETGADLDTQPKAPPPPAPDTSHIQLQG